LPQHKLYDIVADVIQSRRDGGRSGGQDSGGPRAQRPTRQEPREVVKENDLFVKLYDDLLVVPEAEKKDFWDALRRDLPNSFRFTGSKGWVLWVIKLTTVNAHGDIDMHSPSSNVSRITTYPRSSPSSTKASL